MRIIAGKFRRRKLIANPGLVTRPLTDRAKETLFARLEDEMPGCRVADVFAGTGTIGLEALSRGAASAIFLENDYRAFELLKRNVEAIAAEGSALCWRVDALRTSFRPQAVDHMLPFDFAFVDPPYAMISQLVLGSPFFKAMERLGRDAATSPEARLILRTPERACFEFPPVWKRDRQFCLSTMELHLFRKEPPHQNLWLNSCSGNAPRL